MKSFAAIDYVVVVSYLVVIAVLGSSFYRRRSTPKEYFLGGRSMPWLAVGVSIIAADLSAITLMGLPAWSYRHNFELIWLSVAYPLIAPIAIVVFVPFYTRLNLYTAYEYIEKRFHLTLRLVTSLLFLTLRGVHVAVALYAPSLVISFVTGLPVWECILFMGVFTTLYTTLGGMKAVIWTDVIQFVMVMSGIILIVQMAVAHVNGGLMTVYKTALETGHLRFLDLSTDPRVLTSFWACIVGGPVMALAPLATDQAILQRLFTTKSAADCKRSIILEAMLVIPIGLLLYFAGVALFVFYYYHPARLSGLNSPDAIMPFFAVRELPSGVSGLIIASIFAASMAVMSAGINSLTTATTVDFYQRLFRPHEAREHYATVGRIGALCWGVALTGLALFAKHLGELRIAYDRVLSFISGPLLGIFLLGVLSARPTAAGALTGAALGVVTISFVELHTEWSFLYLGPIGVLVTLSTGYLASLFMKPPPPEKIRGLVIGQATGIDSSDAVASKR